jgi:hypothetical protein
MADDRLTLAIPVDVARQFDSTVSQAQIDASTFQNSTDDNDLLAGMIEDAEDEFRARTDDTMRISRVGVAGQRETYEVVSYDLSGHQAYKRNWTGVTTDYRQTEVTTGLDQTRVLPFDSTLGDEIYIYRGLRGQTGVAGNTWEDITDEENETWAIQNYNEGRIVFDPVLLFESNYTHENGVSVGGRGRLRELKVAISYRYGGLGGSRAQATATDLAEQIDDSQTDTVSVSDGSRFPTGESAGSIIVLVEREYLRITPDPANDQLTINERGVRGTTATSHPSGARVQYTPPAIRKAVASRAGMQLITAGRYSEWLPDTDDTIDKSDMQDTMAETWNTTIEALSG